MSSVRILSVVGLSLCVLFSAYGKERAPKAKTPSSGKIPTISVFFVGEDDAANPIAAEAGRIFRLELRKEKRATYADVNVLLEDANPPGKLALDDGKKLYKQGKELLDQLKPDDAFPVLNDAWASYASAFSYLTDEDKAELKELCLDLAKSSFLAKKKQALTPEIALHRAFLLDPELAFNAKRLSPRMEKIFSDAKTSKQDSPKTSFRVESAPSFSEVYINGAFVGVTPLALTEVTVGENFVSVRKDGYEKYTNVVAVSPSGKSQEVALLTQLPEGKLLEEAIKESRLGAGNIKPSQAMMEFYKFYQLDLVAFGDVESTEDGKVKIVVYLYDLRPAKLERINRREIIIDPTATGRDAEYNKLVNKLFLEEVKDSKGKPIKDKSGKNVEVAVDLSGVKKAKSQDVCDEQIKALQLSNGGKPVDREEVCGLAKQKLFDRRGVRIALAAGGIVVVGVITRVLIFAFASKDFDCDPDKDGGCVGVDLDGDGNF
jgi:hypothetical protein